jgi:hypothetical protein
LSSRGSGSSASSAAREPRGRDPRRRGHVDAYLLRRLAPGVEAWRAVRLDDRGRVASEQVVGVNAAGELFSTDPGFLAHGNPHASKLCRVLREKLRRRLDDDVPLYVEDGSRTGFVPLRSGQGR